MSEVCRFLAYLILVAAAALLFQLLIQGGLHDAVWGG
jgi:hypothetical protein